MTNYLASSPETVTTRIHTLSSISSRVTALQIRTILVPMDFSRESLRVLEYAIVMARKFGATIHVLHVRPSKEASAMERADKMMLNYPDTIDFLQDRLADVQRKHNVKFSPDHCHVSSGRPFEEICKLAREIDADVIALPTRGHAGLKRVVLGSTAERVIRYAPCPVLIPRGKIYKAALAGLGARSDLNIRKILVPVDFSASSAEGVRYAIFLAAKYKAALHLFHAVYPHADLVAQDRMSGNLLSVLEAAQLSARRDMKGLKRRYVPKGMACEMEIRTGYPIDQICAQSGGPGVDLAVISTHGRTGFRHALIGSVAEHVARYAECPVMVVPSKPRT